MITHQIIPILSEYFAWNSTTTKKYFCNLIIIEITMSNGKDLIKGNQN